MRMHEHVHARWQVSCDPHSETIPSCRKKTQLGSPTQEIPVLGGPEGTNKGTLLGSDSDWMLRDTALRSLFHGVRLVPYVMFALEMGVEKLG